MLNYFIFDQLTLCMEKHLLELERSGQTFDIPLEEKALEMAIEEVYEANGKKWKPWAKNARSLRVGEVILIVDSDTIVPEVSLGTLIYKKQTSSSFHTFFIATIRIALEMLPVSWLRVPRWPSSNTNQVSQEELCESH